MLKDVTFLLFDAIIRNVLYLNLTMIFFASFHNFLQFAKCDIPKLFNWNNCPQSIKMHNKVKLHTV